jgi:hypothetical protein
MNYVYKSCNTCGKESRPITIQAYFCKACEKYFEKTPSAEAVEKGKRYNKLIWSVYGLLIVLVGATFLLPIDTDTRKNSILVIVFSCLGWMVYKIHKLKLNPLQEPTIIEIDEKKFKDKLRIYKKRDIQFLSIYTIAGIIGISVSAHYETYLILAITLPMLGMLIYYPCRRLYRISKLL